MGTDDKKLHNTGTFRKKQVIKNFISVDFWGNMLRQVNCQVNCSIASSCNELSKNCFAQRIITLYDTFEFLDKQCVDDNLSIKKIKSHILKIA